MKNHKRETFVQIIISILFLAKLIVLDYLLNRYGLPQNPTGMLYLSIGLIFIVISYFYVFTHLLFRKNTSLLKHKLWNKLPFFAFIISFLSFLGFIISFNILFNMFEIWNILLLFIIIYFLILYFVFILSIVHRFSSEKNKIIHYAYVWALIPIIIILITYI
ncbi:hypothetical protein [Pseudogracilibacillus sp. SO30301A]|uniref:hypothetical protein n=1 Tax=Pseudogracilibacillus sp. SO30301A TaxID=3098291 RepID=UPI00300E187D